MKKFLLGLLLLVFVLLTALYFAVNSPWLIDKLARKYAPEYGFTYKKIYGNPLKGIVLDDLSYHGRELARTIRIRLNPYTLLEKQLTVSRLEVLGVDVPVLEKVVTDFTTPASEENTTEESSGGGLPISILVNNIRLSLLPFERYGIKVFKEELSVDSIHYADDSFSVGKLHQVADTSLGRVELGGTYRKRFLDVAFLAIDDLDMPKLEKLIATLSAPAESNGTSATKKGEEIPDKSGDKKEELSQSTDEDPFLPKRIRAAKVRASFLPYEPVKGVKLARAQVEGHGLDIDLEHSRIVSGKLMADLQSNLTQARLKLHVKKGRFIVDNGLIEGVDLQALSSLGADEGNGTKPKARAKAENSPAEASAPHAPYDTIPFVPRYVDIRQLRIELKPGELQKVRYHAAVAKIRDLSLDLHREKLQAKGIDAYLDSSLAHADLSASIDPQSLHVKELALTEIDPVKIVAWQKSVASESNATKEKSASPDTGRKERGATGSTGSSGIDIPFLPSRVDVDRILVEARPFKLAPLDANVSRILLEKLRIDLDKAMAEKGDLKVLFGSNLADLKLQGTIRDNRLILDPKSNRILLPPSLFAAYKLPLRPEAFSPIRIGGSVDEKGAKVALSFSARKILEENNESNASFNVDIDRSRLQLDFDFKSGKFRVTDDTLVTTPQAPVTLHAELGTDEKGAIRYHGFLKAPGVKLGDPRLEKLLGKPKVDFEGDLHSVLAKLDAGDFAGAFRSDDFKKGLLTLGTKKRLEPARYVKLPKELQEAALQLEITTPVDFSKPLPLDTNLTLRSNVADLDGKIIYDGNVSAGLIVHFPKNSLLKKLLPDLNLAALDPLKISLDQRGPRWLLALQSREVKADVRYDVTDEKVKGVLKVAGSEITISGSPRSTILAKLHSTSVKNLIRNLTEIYKMEIPKLDGDIDLTMTIAKLSAVTLELKSKKFIPDDSARIKNPIKNIELVLGADLKTKSLIIKRYSLESGGMKIFATKPSRIQMKDNKINLDALWVNDSLKATGYYDLKKKKGEFVAKSPDFKVVHENAKLDASINLTAKITGDQVDAEGKIILLGGNVMYDLTASHYATDEDIVIVQHQKKNDESFFKKNVQLMLYIETKKPLIFKQKNVYVELNPQLSIIKSFNGDLQVLGSVRIPKGGYYIFDGKKFVLQESSVNFTGKPTRPLLDINLEYRRYSKTVYITVNGVATEPNLNFSSDPYMTRSQILSFILFDTVDSGQNADDMLSMVGGGIAKSILGNMGLKVDTLIVTTEGFEVGKKITKKITVLYDQKEEDPKVIVRIQHSRHTETDISVGSESQSVDIIYKREF
ncbi:translocation/assembly module TamB domain-containing protein [Nitratifractor sp.]|uniref:translocation/assembly module TamB domain-containing protein n=1 Tax=Nitratifractor sp. TaxID=2268144 RepID=UPI0026006393|nr:translocation/assembly module TamB domain-containing protein [Nitratifractor sp.]